MHFIKQLCFLPHTKLISQQLHLNLILQPGYSQPQFGPISRHGPWSCWLTLGKSCATWDWNYWVGSLEWGRVLVQEGPGWVDAMQLGFESSVFHWWFYKVERRGRESKYWLCSLCKKTYIFKPKEGNANANVNGVKMVSVYLLWSYAQVLDIGNFSIPIL